MKNKISAKPPILSANTGKDIFIKGAENKVSSSMQNSALPWNQPHVRNDIKKAFTVQLPEECILKLQYIKEQTNQSQQKIVRESVIECVDKIISQIIG